MSFGKNQGQLANIPVFGGNYIQRGKTAVRRPQFESGGSFHWKGNYRPPKHAPEMVRLLRGEYPQQITHDGTTIVTETFPYYMYREHASRQGKVTKSSVCSAGPLFRSIFGSQYLGEPCHCCPIWAEDVKIRQEKKKVGDNTRGPNRMGNRDMFAFSVFDYGFYFELPDTDKQGQIRMNPRTNQPYTSWVKGNPNDPAMAGRPWKQGMLLPWDMGKSHWSSIINYDANVIGRMCKTCGTRDSIVCVMKICGNPECGQFIYDPNSTSLTEDQRQQIDYYPHTCKYCGHTGYVAEVIECLNPGCNDPERTRIFDVDIMVQRMQSGEGNQTNLHILNFSEPRPIQISDVQRLEELKPLDLAKKFKPTPLDIQLKIHGIQGLPAQGTTAAMTQPQMAAPTAMAGIQQQAMQPAMPPVVQPGMVPAYAQMVPGAQQVGPQPMQQPMMAPAYFQQPQAMMPMQPQQPVQPQPQPVAAVPAVPYQLPQQQTPEE